MERKRIVLLLGATIASFADFGRLVQVGLQLRSFDQAMIQGGQEHRVEGVRGGAEGIIRPKAGFANRDESGPTEVGKMAGGGGLRDLQNRYQIANTQLPAAQEQQDAQAEGFREGLKL